MADFLTFASAEPFTIGVYNSAKNWDGILEYSTDTTNWTEWDGTAAVESAEHGGEQRIYMRGSGNTVITGNSWSMAIYVAKYNFVLSGSNIRCEGNIENLLDYEKVANGEHPDMGSYCFSTLFYNCKCLITAPELPSVKLTSDCYGAMFEGCSGLTVAPKLPATEMAYQCYHSMFRYCHGLTVAPELPATALANNCYTRMFEGSKGLEIVPPLPATELAYACYAKMFQGCDGLTTIPELPATTLADYCYDSMFYNASVKLSETQSDEYPNEYRIPSSGEGTAELFSVVNMFHMTDGTFTGTPSINTIYYTANEVIYPDIPAEPTPHDPTSLFLGWLVGRQIAGMRGKQPVIPDVPVEPDEPSGEIVGYLYNGVQLPDINEVWTDKQTYSYAYIVSMEGVTGLFVSADMPTVVSVDGVEYIYVADGAVGISALVENAWGEMENGTGGGSEAPLTATVWSNHDIINPDGSIYLAASDPIPVYE